MCIRKYKSLYRGAFALAISLLEVKAEKTRESIMGSIASYLNVNNFEVDFNQPIHRAVIEEIMKAGEDVYYQNKSMDKSLESLSRGLFIDLSI